MQFACAKRMGAWSACEGNIYRRFKMQFVIWGLLVVFCLCPVIVASVISSKEDKDLAEGGHRK